MKALALIVVLGLVGCGDNLSAMDAVDASSELSPADASLMHDALGQSDALDLYDASHELARAYAISWTCERNCILDTPYRYQDLLELSSERALFHRSSCGRACDGNIEIPYIRAEGRCLVYGSTSTYRAAEIELCASNANLTGQLEYEDVAGASSWSLIGVEVMP